MLLINSLLINLTTHGGRQHLLRLWDPFIAPSHHLHECPYIDVLHLIKPYGDDLSRLDGSAPLFENLVASRVSLSPKLKVAVNKSEIQEL